MRYWMSWIVPDEDYRPITFPPNQSVLGWWKSGETSNEEAILCGLISAPDEEAAKNCILEDWPGVKWRFCEPKDSTYVVSSDRFPLSEWMKSRMKKEVVNA